MGKEDGSATTWVNALKQYCYPVKLSTYEKAADFPRFFKKIIRGDRQSTIEFEDYFRAQAPNIIEVWYEVVFWKLFSQKGARHRTTNRVVDCIQHHHMTAGKLWEVTRDFIKSSDISNFRKLRSLLGLTYGLAVPLTLVAFADPKQYPMVDKKVALWVKKNGEEHSTLRANKLLDFKSYDTEGATYFRDTDFDAYLKWACWCREVATVLSTTTEVAWRARDVEMAVFTAYDKGLSLSVLP